MQRVYIVFISIALLVAAYDKKVVDVSPSWDSLSACVWDEQQGESSSAHFLEVLTPRSDTPTRFYVGEGSSVSCSVDGSDAIASDTQQLKLVQAGVARTIYTIPESRQSYIFSYVRMHGGVISFSTGSFSSSEFYILPVAKAPTTAINIDDSTTGAYQASGVGTATTHFVTASTYLSHTVYVAGATFADNRSTLKISLKKFVVDRSTGAHTVEDVTEYSQTLSSNGVRSFYPGCISLTARVVNHKTTLVVGISTRESYVPATYNAGYLVYTVGRPSETVFLSGGEGLGTNTNDYRYYLPFVSGHHISVSQDDGSTTKSTLHALTETSENSLGAVSSALEENTLSIDVEAAGQKAYVLVDSPGAAMKCAVGLTKVSCEEFILPGYQSRNSLASFGHFSNFGPAIPYAGDISHGLYFPSNRRFAALTGGECPSDYIGISHSGGWVCGKNTCTGSMFLDYVSSFTCSPCTVGCSCSGGIRTPCPASQFALYGSGTCRDCPAHSSVNADQSDCLADPGYYWSGPIIYACDEGYTCAGGDAMPVKCGVSPNNDYSFYTDQKAQTTCFKCYYPNYTPGHKSCTATDANLVPNSEWTAMVTCPAGTRPSTVAGAGLRPEEFCVSCEAGYACKDGVRSPCLPGTYQPSPGQSACLVAPIDHYVAQAAQIAFQPCPSGQHSLPGSSACVSPPIEWNTVFVSSDTVRAGFYVTQGGYAGAKTLCRDANAATVLCGEIEECTGAYYSPVSSGYTAAKMTCIQCPPSSSSTGSSCACDPGTKLSGSSFALECSPCAAGNYCRNGMEIQCQLDHWSAEGASECSQCDPGSFSRFDFTGCYSCPASTYYVDDSCKVCPEGNYVANLPRRTSCEPCDRDSYCTGDTNIPCADLTGASICSWHPDTKINTISTCGGGATPNEGHKGCILCPAGFKCPDGRPVPCEGATFSPEGVSSCTACDPGYRSDADHLGCHYCEPPKTVSADGIGCTLCAATECYSTAALGCISLDDLGQFEVCISGEVTTCSKNEYKTGPSQCTSCPAGHFCSSGAPVPCPLNTYSSGGASECLPCGEGYGVVFEGGLRVGCSACDATAGRATFSNSFTESCVECPVGHYCDGSKKKSCSLTNQYQDEVGAMACKDCEPGRYIANQATECRVCEEAHHCPGSGSPPVPCTSLTGALYCSGQGLTAQCDSMKYIPSGRLACQDCPAASMCFGTDSVTDCLQFAGTGTVCDQFSHSIVECLAGEVPNSVHTGCRLCLAGSYCPDGASEKPCDAGFFAGAAGSSQCSPCSSEGLATYSDYSGAVRCQQCDDSQVSNYVMGLVDEVSVPVADSCVACDPQTDSCSKDVKVFSAKMSCDVVTAPESLSGGVSTAIECEVSLKHVPPSAIGLVGIVLLDYDVGGARTAPLDVHTPTLLMMDALTVELGGYNEEVVGRGLSVGSMTLDLGLDVPVGSYTEAPYEWSSDVAVSATVFFSSSELSQVFSEKLGVFSLNVPLGAVQASIEKRIVPGGEAVPLKLFSQCASALVLSSSASLMDSGEPLTYPLLLGDLTTLTVQIDDERYPKAWSELVTLCDGVENTLQLPVHANAFLQYASLECAATGTISECPAITDFEIHATNDEPLVLCLWSSVDHSALSMVGAGASDCGARITAIARDASEYPQCLAVLEFSAPVNEGPVDEVTSCPLVTTYASASDVWVGSDGSLLGAPEVTVTLRRPAVDLRVQSELVLDLKTYRGMNIDREQMVFSKPLEGTSRALDAMLPVSMPVGLEDDALVSVTVSASLSNLVMAVIERVDGSGAVLSSPTLFEVPAFAHDDNMVVLRVGPLPPLSGGYSAPSVGIVHGEVSLVVLKGTGFTLERYSVSVTVHAGDEPMSASQLAAGGVLGFAVLIVGTMVFYKMVVLPALSKKAKAGALKELHSLGFEGKTAGIIADLAQLLIPGEHIDFDGEVLGRGGFGVVKSAKYMDAPVVIKQLHPHLINDEGAVSSLCSEALVQAELVHPHVVRFLGIVAVAPSLGHIAEFCPNGSLKDIRDDGGLTPLDRRLELLQHAAAGLAFMHNRQYCHRDIKAANVFIGSDNKAKLGDLGLAHCVAEGCSVSKADAQALGTPAWMAPEALEGNKYDELKADVYAFGIMMWEVLFGQEPYADVPVLAIAVKVVNEGMRPHIPRDCGGVPRPVLALMRACWEQEPDQRPSMTHVEALLSNFAPGNTALQ